MDRSTGERVHMYVIAIIGQKGGTGKTTVAVALAAQAAKAGQTVAVIDTDPQANAANWKDRRQADDMVVLAAPVARLVPTLESARKSGADLIIIDTPGKNDSAAIAAARAADIVFIPCRGHLFDMETLTAVRDLLYGAGNPPAFVLFNAIHPTATKSAEELKAVTAELCGLPSCPVHLCHRASYGDAPDSGQAPQEIDSGKAAAEIENLYRFAMKGGKGYERQQTRRAQTRAQSRRRS
ncbi:MAG: AAA family ATPase [Acidobacteria bacterium]|nr:AAA family ATPase [Acidobacteriota bacterium]